MAYDEIYDGIHVRPLYRDYLEAHSKLSARDRKQTSTRARAIVSRDADFLPLARMMSQREYGELQDGVRQRGRALRMLLVDHYFGGRRYERSGILTKTVLNKIRGRYKLPSGQPPLRPENIQFWYAPDIIRDHTGAFRVIEDNIGFVGGIGDLEAFALAAEVLGSPVPEAHHPRGFYRSMITAYGSEARQCGGGKTILLSYPKPQRMNHEDQRLEEIFEALQVTTITNLRHLKVREDGLYHGDDRVGFVIVNMQLEDIDPVSSARYRIANFWQKVSQGQLGVSYAPGLDFVGDKEFGASTDAFVEFYLGEKCSLLTLPTVSLSNLSTIRKLEQKREQLVIKLSNGQSGESVWIGKKMSQKNWSPLLKRIEVKRGDYVAQAYCEPSTFLGHAVDLRPLAVISSRGELVSPIPWGRATNLRKAKTNISQGGLLAPVVVVP